jgi:hypothetical protein
MTVRLRPLRRPQLSDKETFVLADGHSGEETAQCAAYGMGIWMKESGKN